MHRAAKIIFCATLTACGTLPDVPEPTKAVEASDTYPSFVPISEVTLLHSADHEERNLEIEDTLEARVAGLQARAEKLRQANIE